MADHEAEKLLDKLVKDVPIKANPRGIPSLWYMPLVGGENFFDGFGFHRYCKKFSWSSGPSDEHEKYSPPKRPLLPFLEHLDRELPKKWSTDKSKFVQNDDWLLLDLDR